MVHETPQSSPRQRRRRRRMRRIIEAAMSILVEDGLDGLTISRLAEDLDYTPGALYRYFDSKDDILLGVQRLAVEGFATAFGAAQRLGRQAAGEDADDRIAGLVELWAIFEAYRQLAARWPTRFGMLATSMADPRLLVESEDARTILAPFFELMEIVRASIERAAPVAEAAAVPHEEFDRTIGLLSGLMGVLTLRKASRFAPELLDVDRISRQTFRAIVRGWGVDGALIEAARGRLDEALGESTMLQTLDLQEDLP